jgi:hypothetical protein
VQHLKTARRWACGPPARPAGSLPCPPPRKGVSCWGEAVPAGDVPQLGLLRQARLPGSLSVALARLSANQFVHWQRFCASTWARQTDNSVAIIANFPAAPLLLAPAEGRGSLRSPRCPAGGLRPPWGLWPQPLGLHRRLRTDQCAKGVGDFEDERRRTAGILRV